MPRILVMGASGLLGRALVAAWESRPGSTDCTVWGTFFSQPGAGLLPLDIRDAAAAAALVRDVRPDVIALPASNPGVDYCEQHPEETRAINVEGSLNICRLAKAVGSVLVFFSSDYVFDGTAEPYAETDPPRPLNEYGWQKVEVERAILASLSDFLIIRVSGLYGWESKGKNFVLQAIRASKAGQPIRAASDQFYHPTYAENAAAVVRELVARGARGIFHVVGRDRVSRYEFGQVVAEVFGLDRALLVPTPMSVLSPTTPRPLRTGLLTEKVRRLASTPLWGIREGLGHMKQTEGTWGRQPMPAPGR